MGENVFRIVDIWTYEDKAFFGISFDGDEKTREYYLETCFLGVYLLVDSQKYSLWTVRKGDLMEAELLCDAILHNIVSKKPMSLFVRLQVGSRVWDQPVLACRDVAGPLSFGHWNTCYCTPASNFQFSFTNLPTAQWDSGSYPAEASFWCQSIRVSEGHVELDLAANAALKENESSFPGRYDFSLAWKDVKSGQVYRIHESRQEGTDFTYLVPKDEIVRMGTLELNRYVFEWYMEDIEGRKYPIVWIPYPNWKRLRLPTSEFWGEIFQGKNRVLSVRISTTGIFFDFLGAASDGRGFLLRYEKTSYTMEMERILACNISKDVMYEYSLQIMEETPKEIVYGVSMQCQDVQELFQEGAFQFFVDVKEGVFEKRFPVRIRTEELLTNSVRLTVCLPYFVHQDRYYNVIPYLDNNNHFKCLIDRKFIRTEVEDCSITEEEIDVSLDTRKEPFFDRVRKVQFRAEDGEYFPANWEILEENHAHVRIRIRAAISIFDAIGMDRSLFPVLSFHDGSGMLFVQDNDACPFAEGRNAKGGSLLATVGNGKQARLWAEHQGDSFAIGLSWDLQMFLLDQWEYKDGMLRLRAECMGRYMELQGDVPVCLALEDVFEKKAFEGSAKLSDGILNGEIPVEELPCSTYVLWVTWKSGKSGLLMSTRPSMLICNEARKKILPKQMKGVLSISVEELLLYEDVTRKSAFEEIARKAEEERASAVRPVWLVGERYGVSARDNGLAFFKYCMSRTNLIADVYYVSKKESPDWEALEPYKEHVVVYDSKEHIRLDALAEFYIVSHGIRDVMPSLYHDQCYTVYRKPVIYLQHGITAMKKMNISNQSYGCSIRKFFVCSEFEAQLLVKHNQFFEDELAVTGFARYDLLDTEETRIHGTESYILI